MEDNNNLSSAVHVHGEHDNAASDELKVVVVTNDDTIDDFKDTLAESPADGVSSKENATTTTITDVEQGENSSNDATAAKNVEEKKARKGPSSVVLKDLSDYDEDDDASSRAARKEVMEMAVQKYHVEYDGNKGNGAENDDFDPNSNNKKPTKTLDTSQHDVLLGSTIVGKSDTTLDSTIEAMIHQPPYSYSRYKSYDLDVDPNNDDKAIEVLLCNFSRPHMRAFHFSWMCFFVAFFIWFAIAPLLGEIRTTLNLTKEQVWLSNISSIGGTIVLRFINGAQCDKYGARLLMGWTLILVSVPTACTGFVNSSTGLIVLRFFIGFAGSTFVMCQFWTSRMFTKEVAGTANALVAGWGNLGGGVTQLIMGSVLFPLFKTGMSAELAWRTVSLVPAAVAIIMGILCICLTDDAPKGYYKDLKKHGAMSPDISATSSFKEGAYNRNTWLLFIQYATCFGVELTMNNASALYFIDVFEMTTEQAGAIASLFGWMNLFARAVGGYVSDYANIHSGMRGRLWVQTLVLLGEGILVIAFSHTHNLVVAIIVLVCFSMFVQAAEGSTYGILPYVNPPVTGSIAGIVGGGGNVGAVIFGVCFHQLPYQWAFDIMGALIIVSCFCSLGIRIPGLAGLVTGEDCPQAIRDRTRAA